MLPQHFANFQANVTNVTDAFKKRTECDGIMIPYVPRRAAPWPRPWRAPTCDVMRHVTRPIGMACGHPGVAQKWPVVGPCLHGRMHPCCSAPPPLTDHTPNADSFLTPFWPPLSLGRAAVAVRNAWACAVAWMVGA